MIRFATALTCLLFSALMGADEKPNIVFIMADDLGYGDLGCYGCGDILTPNLDRLASEGIRFTDFYANASVCSPTRIAFLTGRYQQRFGMDNALYYQEMGRGLPGGGATIASALADAGYATGLVGKWHVGYDSERQPLQQGFDYFFGLLGGNHHYFEHMDRSGVHDLWLGSEATEREGYSTDLFTEEAIGFIQKNHEVPFFLFLSHAAPHFPFQGPNDKDKEVVPKKKSWQEGDRETYAAMVERMDEGIGAVLDELEKYELAADTIVVFTSDNGGSVHARNAPFSGKKSEIWEGGTRVPCIVRWPGKIAKATETNQIGITMDWTSTFLRMAGADLLPEGEDGLDLLPVLTGKREDFERTLFWRRKHGPKRKGFEEGVAVRKGDWKLIDQAEGESFLFHLR
ncbi:MAG: sulfatase-like hydrolase/transferase, partial [Verrucomicrobiales bacterium]|nr:sulfatase-like hydrolase/transferase [Verrucomicrobiales bacterium]